MARIGKIARLPQELREELNRRMADGEVGGSLLRWLNGLPEVRKVLAVRFGDAAITKQNLSEWRKGGFREWQTRQDLFADARKLSSRAQEIREVAGDKLKDDLATVLAGQYAMVLNRWLAQPTQELEARLRVLHGLCVDIVALRRQNHAVARLEFDLERWEFDRERMLKQMAAREREQAEGQGESNLVQVKNLHRGDAEARRECELGEGATERVERAGGGGRGESKLVQAKKFSGALGSGVRTTAEAGEHSRWAELLPGIYMFAKEGVSFSVSPNLGWSVGTVGREAVNPPELQARRRFSWLKPGVNERREESGLPPGHPCSFVIRPTLRLGTVESAKLESCHRLKRSSYSRPVISNI